MASTLEELQTHIELATQPGFRHQLLARGQSRAMIWREGILPPDAPNFSPELSEDLLSYGYSLLTHALRYSDIGGEPSIVRGAFEIAAEAIEAVAAKGEAQVSGDFHLLVAAAAYHLGRYSARAYSLLHQGLAKSNLSVIEMALAKLMLRDIDGLANDVSGWFGSGIGSESALIEALKPNEDDVAGAGGEEDADDRLQKALNVALEGNFMAAMSLVMLSLERGDENLTTQACQRLRQGLDVTGELNLVTQWWVHRISIQLVQGLWDTSFHNVLPLGGPPQTDIGDWTRLRKLFLASLYCRGKAEVELWPSQLQAAQRVLDLSDNLVLSLPTSAGKTRIAELCILACLAQNKRIVFVTPLRALSAQTEIGLRRTFTPLGKTVSSLYGSIGASGADIDALRTRHIVVATPEKLDFALRSDPTLLNDVGLVVLDEGHMIGLGEREVRYEAQIQRLLRRQDASSRRVVCLSAILPDGDQLEDFAAWLTNDKLDGLIKDSWRPTRLRFGEVDWRGQHAQLNFTVGDEKPYIPRFVVGKSPTKGRGTKIFPSNQTELCLATAWRLVSDGQTVLIFCPLRKSVLSIAKSIIEMHKRGHIGSVLETPEVELATALLVGAEWFGPNHEILACLKLGVAVHHGALPTPYRKEIERLLREGVLKITVSSPTLAQGLNLAATSLVFHGLKRNRANIDVAEFRNVVGRAGRAYIDIEGLVLYPMFDEHKKRRAAWRELSSSSKGREMESGILRLVFTLLVRMSRKLGSADLNTLLTYVTGQGAWDFPVIAHESEKVSDEERGSWNSYLMSLDTALLSLLGETAIADEDVEMKLEEILASSLFQRRLARQSEPNRLALRSTLAARAMHIWSETTALQRRGYFLAGVGLATGQELDDRAEQLENHLLFANIAIQAGETEMAIDAISSFAEIAFQISSFTPRKLVDDWKSILRLWLSGQPLESASDDTIQFIEQAFVYNLPWAMEAVRVRADVHRDPLAEDLALSNYPRAYPVTALETGTLSFSAAILIQAGFASRVAAIRAVELTEADFDSMDGLKAWLGSPEILALSEKPDWPTPESHDLWLAFLRPATTESVTPWTSKTYQSPVTWIGAPLPAGVPLRLGGASGSARGVFTAEYQEVGLIGWTPNPNATGIVVATSNGTVDKLSFEYIGPDDLII
ncbi:DEAD/DEAH box helicase [Pseudomonas lundensis]|uniref:DEAD/DEAH box helicase n=1 Tax=Pseudomonas TaxID=286 RepID=UPI000641CE0F|nr:MULTISPECIES: DEAD/DEAH box helicase [Pseudomonas]NNA13702.1 DEAD/DEAH box helicase [Pseudomonas lundensis]